MQLTGRRGCMCACSIGVCAHYTCWHIVRTINTLVNTDQSVKIYIYCALNPFHTAGPFWPPNYLFWLINKCIFLHFKVLLWLFLILYCFFYCCLCRWRCELYVAIMHGPQNWKISWKLFSKLNKKNCCEVRMEGLKVTIRAWTAKGILATRPMRETEDKTDYVRNYIWTSQFIFYHENCRLVMFICLYRIITMFIMFIPLNPLRTSFHRPKILTGPHIMHHYDWAWQRQIRQQYCLARVRSAQSASKVQVEGRVCIV